MYVVYTRWFRDNNSRVQICDRFSVKQFYINRPSQLDVIVQMSDLMAILNDPSLLFVDTFLPEFSADSTEFKLLSIFAYGTWQDYKNAEPSLPPELKLDPQGQAVKKLKKLTLLSIFAQVQVAEFDKLMKQVSIENYDDLESLVIDLMANDYLDAKIDEQRKSVICTRCSARCVRNDKNAIMERVAQIRKIRKNIANALTIPSPGADKRK